MIMVRNVVLFLALVGVPVFAVPSSKRTTIIKDNLYFSEITVNRNRAQALAYCASQDGELAKVTKDEYNILRMTLPAVGTYWIDGIDKPSDERFDVTKNCTAGSGKVDLSGIPAANLDLQSSSCLVFVKGANAATSRIQSLACSTVLKGVLCSFPLNGCVTAPTTVATAPIG